MGICPQCNSIMDDYDIGVCNSCRNEKQCTGCDEWFMPAKLTAIKDEEGDITADLFCPECLKAHKEILTTE
jgi:hypothetical protein